MVDVGEGKRSWSSELTPGVGVEVGALVGRGVGVALGVGSGIGSGVGLGVDTCVGDASGPEAEAGASKAGVTGDSADTVSVAAGSPEIPSRLSSEASMDGGIFAKSGPSRLSAGCLGTALSSSNVSDTGLSDGTPGVTVQAAITMTTGNTIMI
ncbi:MAG: hypothetical protein IIC83_14095 [Chloroflexi bacterium]|nr:hypothetical protein [Chloroflexota bacterium]